jgi:predicted Zn-dependent protease
MIAVRIALVALALAAGAWLAVQERAAVADEELTDIAFRSQARPTDPQLARLGDLLDRLRRLNPDRRPDLLEAFVLYRTGRDNEALAVLGGAVRDEPENVEAWALLARIAETADPALAARARARLRELAPPVPLP